MFLCSKFFRLRIGNDGVAGEINAPGTRPLFLFIYLSWGALDG